MARTVEFNFFDKPRNLLFTFNAIADAEEYLNCGLAKIFSEERQGFSTTRTLLAFGLKHEDKNITPEKVGVMLQKAMQAGATLEEMIAPVMKAIETCGLFSQKDDDGTDSPNDQETTAQ